jgi:hypothetical protein
MRAYNTIFVKVRLIFLLLQAFSEIELVLRNKNIEQCGITIVLLLEHSQTIIL